MPSKIKQEKSVAFIVARLSSSRLPGKQFRRIGDRTILDWVLWHLSQSRELDEIVLATVAEPENLPLKEFAEKHRIPCFWFKGDVDHVTTRLRKAAEAYQADICVLISADCPLIHAPSIDTMIRALKNAPGFDTVQLKKNAVDHPPALQGVLVNRLTAWQTADDLSNRPELKEHQFPVINQSPQHFNPIAVDLAKDVYMSPHRLSVDTLADLEFMQSVYRHLKEQHRPFNLPNMVALLQEKPGIRHINVHVHQRRLIEDIKKVLFIVDSGQNFGHGHLIRSLALARQITEQLGWPTHFMVDSQSARTEIEASGHKVHWGAIGRPVNTDKSSSSGLVIENVMKSYDLLVIDIFDQRNISSGWRSQISPGTVSVVIENLQPWSAESDLIVLPNLYSGHPTDLKDTDRLKNKPPKLIGGKDFLILRKEIRQAASDPPPKSLDLLVYLHDHHRRQSLTERLATMTIKFKILDGFSTQFAQDLAQAYIFISAFGVSFNEALALGTLPVCWPDSIHHKKDALNFYRNQNLPPLLVESPQEVVKLVPTLLKKMPSLPEPLQDGTANIVTELAQLFCA